MAFKKTVKTQKKTGTKKVSKPGTGPKTKPAPNRKTPKKPAKKTVGKKPAKTPKKATTTHSKKITAKPLKTAIVKKPKTAKLSPREKKIHEIKQKLQRQKNTLLAEAESALNTLPDQTIFPDLGDQASAEIDRNFMLRLRGREQMLLKKIDSAIEKINNGTFGICEVCGQAIELKRLEARPVTNMCIACKTEQEEEEKLRGT